jgi:hypothetical protein
MREWNERDWLLPIAALALIEWLAAEAVAFAIDYPARPDFVGQFMFGGIIGIVMLAGFYLWQIAKLTRRMTANPTRRLIELTRERRVHLMAVAGGLACISLHWVAFSWMKAMLPAAVPFWADPALANFDEALFGRAAWQWALSVTGPASIASDYAYQAWLPLHLVVLAGVLCLPASARKSRILIAYFRMWMTGTTVSFAFSSAGPLFYEWLGFGDRFHDLANHIGGMPKAAAYVWSNYQDHAARPGAGISAIPSRHVALATWIAFAVRHWIGWIYTALVFHGSYLLGWHYFLDAPAGILVTLFAYAAAGVLCAWIAKANLQPAYGEPPLADSLADGPPA